MTTQKVQEILDVPLQAKQAISAFLRASPSDEGLLRPLTSLFADVEGPASSSSYARFFSFLTSFTIFCGRESGPVVLALSESEFRFCLERFDGVDWPRCDMQCWERLFLCTAFKEFAFVYQLNVPTFEQIKEFTLVRLSDSAVRTAFSFPRFPPVLPPEMQNPVHLYD